MRKERIAVACYNAQGEPDFVLVQVHGTDEQFDCGGFNKAARDKADELGYEAPMVLFDSTTPGFNLVRLGWLDWKDSVEVTVPS